MSHLTTGTYRLEHYTLGAVAGTSNNTSTANQTTGQVVQNVTIQVRKHHYIKLVGAGDHLHGAVVHNHGLKLNFGVQFGNLKKCRELITDYKKQIKIL